MKAMLYGLRNVGTTYQKAGRKGLCRPVLKQDANTCTIWKKLSLLEKIQNEAQPKKMYLSSKSWEIPGIHGEQKRYICKH